MLTLALACVSASSFVSSFTEEHIFSPHTPFLLFLPKISTTSFLYILEPCFLHKETSHTAKAHSLKNQISQLPNIHLSSAMSRSSRKLSDRPRKIADFTTTCQSNFESIEQRHGPSQYGGQGGHNREGHPKCRMEDSTARASRAIGPERSQIRPRHLEVIEIGSGRSREGNFPTFRAQDRPAHRHCPSNPSKAAISSF